MVFENTLYVQIHGTFIIHKQSLRNSWKFHRPYFSVIWMKKNNLLAIKCFLILICSILQHICQQLSVYEQYLNDLHGHAFTA